jgi:hypothetical protein
MTGESDAEKDSNRIGCTFSSATELNEEFQTKGAILTREWPASALIVHKREGTCFGKASYFTGPNERSIPSRI